MKRRSTSDILKNKDSESTFELDLAPMLALMVTLIPIMLLATSFVKVRVINTVLPQAVKEAIQNDKNKLSKIIVIDLNMNQNNFVITVKEDEKEVYTKQVQPLNGSWNYSQLHNELYEVKTKFPDKYTMNIYPNEKVPYNEIIKAIDEAREAKKSKAEFNILDKKSNKNIKTRVMFPEVSFSGLIGG